MYDVIIVGAGISGLTAAIYGARANKKVLVLESSSYGGQIVNASVVENYPGISKISGFDLATNLYNQVKELGVEIKYEEVKSISKDKKIITNNNEYQADNIIVATGCNNKRLGIINEDKLIGRGISYCATCDGNFYKGLDVAVVGGGNTALEDALYLADISNKVYLIHRRDSFRGESKYVDELKKKNNVEFILNSTITKINGDTKLSSIEIGDRVLNVSGLFIAIGQEPNSLIFKDLLELDQYGYIKSSDTTTSIDGIYVAGDVRTKEVRQLTTSASDGTIAMMNIINRKKGL